MNDPSDTPDRRRALAREAIAVGDATTALAYVDALPDDERAGWLAQVWMLAGSVRALQALGSPEGIGDADLRARVLAYLAAPPLFALPDHAGPDAYPRLREQADRLAALGRAAELAMTHLALSRASPRSDWRVVHLEHAAALAFGLGDPRLSALVRAFEAERDLDFGEHEDALEAARAALAAGVAHDEPRAVLLGEAVIAAVATGAPTPDAPTTRDLGPDRHSEPEDL